MPASRTAFDGQVIQAKTTFSSGSRSTAVWKEFTLPSGTSSPQHSIRVSAPWSLNIAAAVSAISR
jgi:hypothetical protein